MKTRRNDPNRQFHVLFVSLGVKKAGVAIPLMPFGVLKRRILAGQARSGQPCSNSINARRESISLKRDRRAVAARRPFFLGFGG